MKFPRNARIFRGQLDIAPFAGVFFLLVIFLMLSTLVYTPGGMPLHLPRTDELPGPDKPSVSVGVDARGRLYFQNLSIEEDALANKLHQAVTSSSQPLTLILQMDKAVTVDTEARLWSLARDVGISNLSIATLPRVFPVPPRHFSP